MEILVFWATKVEAETPLQAAQQACALQRNPYKADNRFGIQYLKDGHLYDEEIDLGQENPLGRPAAVVSGDEVCCGHCGSPLTEHLEDTGRHTPLFARFGVAFASLSGRHVYDDGDDERVICGTCGRESELPLSFQWA
ncbi:MAG TPA: hypothetical protein VGP73_18540 [Thermoanaerobaculia bacterium]